MRITELHPHFVVVFGFFINKNQKEFLFAMLGYLTLEKKNVQLLLSRAYSKHLQAWKCTSWLNTTTSLGYFWLQKNPIWKFTKKGKKKTFRCRSRYGTYNKKDVCPPLSPIWFNLIQTTWQYCWLNTTWSIGYFWQRKYPILMCRKLQGQKDIAFAMFG